MVFKRIWWNNSVLRYLRVRFAVIPSALSSPIIPSHDRQILGLFELCPNQPKKIPGKFVLNSIWLIYGSTVIRLQRLQTATCKNMLVSILHNILTSLECLISFHKGVFPVTIGGPKDRNEVRELLKARDFETLTTDYVVNKKGVRRSVSMSDAYYSQFAVKFTGSSCFNVAETSTLFRSVVVLQKILF